MIRTTGVALCATLAFGCVDDGPTQGHRDVCAQAGGALAGCEQAAIDSPEDACWKLVECGAIPLENSPDREFDLDWDRCVERVERLPASRYEFVLACIEASSCDDLKLSGSPTTPGGNADNLCLAYGDF